MPDNDINAILQQSSATVNDVSRVSIEVVIPGDVAAGEAPESDESEQEK